MPSRTHTFFINNFLIFLYLSKTTPGLSWNIFSLVAGLVLCFEFRMRIMFITHGFFSYCWVAYTESRTFQLLTSASEQAGGTQGDGRGQLTPIDQRDIPYHMSPCRTKKLARGQTLLGDWLGISQQVLSDPLYLGSQVHHLWTERELGGSKWATVVLTCLSGLNNIISFIAEEHQVQHDYILSKPTTSLLISTTHKTRQYHFLQKVHTHSLARRS